jgi:hypothetical protein
MLVDRHIHVVAVNLKVMRVVPGRSFKDARKRL